MQFLFKGCWGVAAACWLSAPVFAAQCHNWPQVIAHRGDSGHGPEHTASAYWRAMLQGADFIELDLVPTQDGVLISRHENELSASTNVADLPQFASRKTSKRIDGVSVSGWFSEDFTLAELRQLKARESKPAVRPDNTRFNDQEGLLTLAEVLELVQRFELQHGRAVGIYIETKHPSYFQQQPAANAHSPHWLTEKLLQQLAPWQQINRQPIFIQSFEISNLRWLRAEGLAKYQLQAKLVQLLGDVSLPRPDSDLSFAVPADIQLHGNTGLQGTALFNELATGATPPERPLQYADLITPAGLAFVASYADGIGPWKDQWFSGATARVPHQVLRQQGLLLHPYTFRAETAFLQPAYQSLSQELAVVFQAGVDGVFTDQPAQVLTYRQQVCQQPAD